MEGECEERRACRRWTSTFDASFIIRLRRGNEHVWPQRLPFLAEIPCYFWWPNMNTRLRFVLSYEIDWKDK